MSRQSAYHHLWHLIATGTIEPDISNAEHPDEADHGSTVRFPCKTPAWDICGIDAGKVVDPDENTVADDDSTLVAVIDAGVSKHPAFDDRMKACVDFAADVRGVEFGNNGDLLKQEGVAPNLPWSDIKDLPQISQLVASVNDQKFTDLIDKLAAGSRPLRHETYSRDRYNSHGVACVGLLAGRVPPNQPGGFGYFGVDPSAKILPLLTSFSPDPVQLIAALVFAVANDAHMILFPRDAADPSKTNFKDPVPGLWAADNPGEMLGVTPSKQEMWAVFAEVFKKVAERIPIVCAAGNSALSHLTHPAGLAAGAAANGVIAVGAVTYNGQRAAYSSYGNGLSCVGPSDDLPVYTRHNLRTDPYRHPLVAHDCNLIGGPTPTHAAHQRTLTIDILGPNGYSRSGRWRVPRDDIEMVDARRSDAFTLFGGTSAASSIVAGVVSLMIRKRRDAGYAVDGSSIQTVLKDAASENFAFGLELKLPNRTTDPVQLIDPIMLTPDAANGETDAGNVRFARCFGSGIARFAWE